MKKQNLPLLIIFCAAVFGCNLFQSAESAARVDFARHTTRQYPYRGVRLYTSGRNNEILQVIIAAKVSTLDSDFTAWTILDDLEQDARQLGFTQIVVEGGAGHGWEDRNTINKTRDLR